MSREIAIEVKKLSKYFRLPTERSNSVKQTFVNWTRGVKGYREQKVLRNISFKVEKGDFFGIVGRNGSGKSTLLKLIAGIYEPDGGTVTVNGSLVSFIELGVGFNGELTGRENIYLNGALLGFSTKEIDAMYDEIVEFAELGDFMDQKLKNYSSGMQVRLAFSCAIRAKSDILVLDEILAVGDEAFQKKCNDYFESIRKDKSKTIILVTHGMDNVRRFCNKALLIHNGAVEMSGNPADVANQYSLENFTEINREKSGNIYIKGVSSQVVKSDEEMVFDVVYKSRSDKKLYVEVSFWAGDVHLFTDTTYDMPTNGKGRHSKRYTFKPACFGNVVIKISASLYDFDTRALVGYAKESAEAFYRIVHHSANGAIAEKGEWDE